MERNDSERCRIAKGVVISANSAPAGVCHECGEGPDAHGYPEYRLRPDRGGVDAIVALGLGLPCRWAGGPDA